MPRFNVQRADDKWACFSTIVDAFVTDFLDEEEYEKWRKEEYGRAGWSPVRDCNLMTVDEALDAICLNKSYTEVVAHLRSVGLDTPENIAKILDIRKQCYEELEHDPLYLDDDEKVIS